MKEFEAIQTRDGNILHVGLGYLTDLVRVYYDLGPRFLDRNVRSGLDQDKPTNRSLKRAFHEVVQQRVDPKTFTFNHNGITLAAERVEFSDGVATIVEPRVLNGAQTVTTLHHYLKAHAGDEAVRSGSWLDDVQVVTKIVSSGSNDFITAVTIANNRQNPISPSNLRANDLLQCRFQDKFRQVGLFYERQEKSFANLGDEVLEELGVEAHRPIEIVGFAKSLLALQGEVDRMQKLSEVFESDAQYTACFRRSYFDCDARKLVVVYKVGGMLQRVFRELKGTEY